MSRLAQASVRWYGDRVKRALRAKYRERLQVAAEHLQAKTIENLSAPGPPHSTPGEFPAKISGGLVDSIRISTDSRDLTVRVHADAEYAKYVERIRPFLRRTLSEEKAELRRIILGGDGAAGHFR